MITTIDALPYDAFQIRAVWDDGNDVNWVEDEEELEYLGPRVFWTVYGWRDQHGAQAIGDFTTHEAARNIAQALARTTGLPFVDYTP